MSAQIVCGFTASCGFAISKGTSNGVKTCNYNSCYVMKQHLPCQMAFINFSMVAVDFSVRGRFPRTVRQTLRIITMPGARGRIIVAPILKVTAALESMEPRVVVMIKSFVAAMHGLVLLAVMLCSCDQGAQQHEGASVAKNPFRKVVTMLQMMHDKIIAEGAKEKSLFDTFICFCENSDCDLAKSIRNANLKIP